jgi:hypothetical protein
VFVRPGVSDFPAWGGVFDRGGIGYGSRGIKLTEGGSQTFAEIRCPQNIPPL